MSRSSDRLQDVLTSSRTEGVGCKKGRGEDVERSPEDKRRCTNRPTLRRARGKERGKSAKNRRIRGKRKKLDN
jgi:hypothetical protein